jgi:ACS family tartrate transporter-like MFS transporter
MDDLIEKSAMRKIYLRLLPFAIISYFLAYIDRINVSFAALTMRGDLDISASAYGFALGTFYWGYFIFEVPSNVILEKVGARIWIARIMITWGILAGLTATVTGSTSFGVVRFLLGLAEAGFFPGIVLYFTYWFPTYHHARIVSGFLIGLPLAVAGGDFNRAAGLGWHVRPARLANHVSRRGGADGTPRSSHVFRADRQASRGEIPDRRGKGLAQR